MCGMRREAARIQIIQDICQPMTDTPPKNQLPKLDAPSQAKLRKLLAADRLFPVMNNTKWAELIDAMINSPQMEAAFRLRSVFTLSDYCTDWDREWHYHIHPVAEIEWIELRAASLEWLLSTLRKHNLPFSMEGDIPRVWAYTRPGKQPLWC
jgi:hypothetical protein